MRNTLILLALVSIGLTTPVLARDFDGGRHGKSDQRRVELGQWGQRNYARHDRQDGRYGHFQKRMKNLRKELRHERRTNRRMERRMERRDIRQFKQVARYYDYHPQHYAPVAVAPRRSLLPLLIPGIDLIIPLRW